MTGIGCEILDVGSSDIKLDSTFVAEIGSVKGSVRLPIALVITDANEVGAGGNVTLPVMLSGAVKVGKAVGNEKLVPVVGNGKGKPPKKPSEGKPERVCDADVVVF